MTKRIRILPYRQGSRSARALADAIGGRVLRLEGSRYFQRHNDLIINWGNTRNYDPEMIVDVLNEPHVIRNASNKLTFFNLVAGTNPDIIPPFWTDRNAIPETSYPIVCRTVLAGHSGDGIVIANTLDELVNAPLYVKYIPKQQEYRIHVGKLPNNEYTIISAQRKARRDGFENPNWQVRNHANGFVFVRGDINPPEAVFNCAKQALACTGLDFGAVDVIWNDRQQRAYVLEVNTAPGLEGQTVTDYVSFFREFF